MVHPSHDANTRRVALYSRATACERPVVMAPDRSEFIPAGFFVLRTPLLPVDALTRDAGDLLAPGAYASGGDLAEALRRDRARAVSRLRALVEDPVIAEALFVASPSLDDAIAVWRRDGSDARGAVEVVVRYLARMAARPTPFGLFAGGAVGALDERTRLDLGPREAYRRHTRLDTHFLAALCEALTRDPAIRPWLRVRPCDGLHRTSTQYRYAEARTAPDTHERTYHVVAIERSGPIDALVERASGGATPNELSAELRRVRPSLGRSEVDAFVDSVIDSQLLVHDLAPLVTGVEPIEAIVSTLRGIDGGAEAAAALARTDEELTAFDAARLGIAPSRYRTLAANLAELPVEQDLSRLFHVDLFKPAVSVTLGRLPLREIDRAVRLLARVARSAPRDELTRFRESFLDRYGDASVPLVEALDEELGVGFSSKMIRSAEPSPLIAGLPFRDVTPGSGAALSAREFKMLDGISDATRDGTIEWALSEEDVDALASDTPLALPDTFAVGATILAESAHAVDRGDFRLFLRDVCGPSGAVFLGRFCHGDPELRRAVEAHLRAEEAMRPDVIFAEVVHLPDGRMGNLLCRPVLRRHEIPFHGRSGAAPSLQIPVSDLRVSIVRGRIMLSSVALGREVVPRLTTAHNFPTAALGVYRFLCELQDAEAPQIFSFAWGALNDAPFLPRVTRGRVVLSFARWNLQAADLRLFDARDAPTLYRNVQQLRARLRLPPWVGLVERDNVLPVNLDDALQLESFARLVRGRPHVRLTELILDERHLPVRGPEGRFVHEAIIPYRLAQTSARTEPSAGRPRVWVPRSFDPGSEWLYAKLYTGTSTADTALRRIVAPVVEASCARGDARRWFFIRYADPEPHLRVRFQGDPERLLTRVLPALRDAAKPFREDGRLWKVQFDTYDREIDRYGGDDGIEHAEAIFEADSVAVMSIITRLEGDEGAESRWRIALAGIDGMLLDLDLDVSQRLDVIRRVRDSFAAEHGVDGPFRKQLGARFRLVRSDLESLLSTTRSARSEHGDAASNDPFTASAAAFAHRAAAVAPSVRALSGLHADGRLTRTIQELAPSFIHMHANRMLLSEQRAQELVLYDFLERIYDGEARRGPDAFRERVRLTTSGPIR